MILPKNEVLKNLGDFRTVKCYYESLPYDSKVPILRDYLILERRFENKLGEAYYAKAIINPNDAGYCIGDKEVYRLLQEYKSTLEEILQLVSK